MRSQRWFPVVVGAVVVSCGLMLSLILSDAGTAEKRTESDAEKALRYNNLGIAYLAQYKPAEAERQFRRAVALDPNSIVGHVNIGIAALAQVHYDQAVDAFQAALRLDPDNIYAHFNLSLIYKLQGKPEDALRETLRAADGDPRDPDIQYHIGSLYMTNREYDKAIEKFNTVLKLDPDFLSAYYSLGRAYMAKGNIVKAKEFIEKHRQLQSGAGAGRSVGLRYGEQGRYSYAMDDLGGSGPPPALEPGEVSFIDVTAEAGIRFHQGHPPDVPKLEQDAPPGERSSEQLLSTVIGPMLGSGLALADVNGDGLLDLFLIDGDADNAASRLYLNRGGMRFEQTPLGGPGARPMVTGAAMSAAFGDLDGDADADLVVAFTSRVRAFINDGSGRFTPAPRDSGLGERIGGLLGGISLADVDHDGDLDIHVAGIASSLKPDFKTIAFPDAWAGAKDLLYINATGPASEDGTASRVKFIESAKQFHVAHDRRRSTGAVFSDFDNDRDIDFAVASPGDKTTIFSNMRDGTFRDLGKKSGLPAGARILGIAAGDYNKDGWMDLAVTTWGSGLPRLFRNMQGQPAGTGGGAFALDVTALAEVPRHIAVPQFGLAFLDFDNDGYLDLVTVNGSDIGSALIVLRNDGNGTFTDAGALVGIDRIRAKSGRGLAYGDLDGDGDLDLVISNAGGQPTLLRNDGGNKNHWLNVAAAGLHSNKQAIGTKIEVKSGRLWQKTEVTAGSGYLSQSAIEAHFGLGARRRIDTVRLLWPGGVLQDELKVQADAVFAVQELDRKGSSCPILYAWNGRRMAFISDFLGGSAIGYRTGLDTFNYPDTDEYVKIAADQLKAKDGYFELRFVNQLEETLFFDQARLLVVDHPAGVEVLPDERLMPFPPFPTFRLFSITKASPPLAARDDDGRDLLDAVSRIDRVYAGPVPYGTGRRFK
ncbi:MAG: FG-GAP-like repeat-containing protein, partial [Acidobacteriota bacterium]